MQGGASAEDAEGSGDLESVGQGRRTAANVPVGAPVGAMLVIAHVKNLLESQGTLTVPAEDNDLARYAAGRWVGAGEEAMAAHPYAPGDRPRTPVDLAQRRSTRSACGPRSLWRTA